MMEKTELFLCRSRRDDSKRWSPETPHNAYSAPHCMLAHTIERYKTWKRTMNKRAPIFNFSVSVFLGVVKPVNSVFTIEMRTNVCCVRSPVHEMNKNPNMKFIGYVVRRVCRRANAQKTRFLSRRSSENKHLKTFGCRCHSYRLYFGLL